MNEAGDQPKLFRFATFELDVAAGELRKDGKSRPRMRDQALQILVTLLERAEEVVTRDELRERLWPADTFVDFDHGLNTAINQVRSALGDTAANPRQTRGSYRPCRAAAIVSWCQSRRWSNAFRCRPMKRKRWNRPPMRKKAASEPVARSRDRGC